MKTKQFKDKEYKIQLAKTVRTALVQHIVATPEKETVFISHDSINGDLTFWVDGKFKIVVSDLTLSKIEVQNERTTTALILEEDKKVG